MRRGRLREWFCKEYSGEVESIETDFSAGVVEEGLEDVRPA